MAIVLALDRAQQSFDQISRSDLFAKCFQSKLVAKCYRILGVNPSDCSSTSPSGSSEVPSCDSLEFSHDAERLPSYAKSWQELPAIITEWALETQILEQPSRTRRRCSFKQIARREFEKCGSRNRTQFQRRRESLRKTDRRSDGHCRFREPLHESSGVLQVQLHDCGREMR